MNADLQRLIVLQQIDSAIHEAERRLAGEPARIVALEVRLSAARDAVAEVKAQMGANQAARRDIEKDVAMHQARLSKFRDQAMAVKTNQEYHALQHEIAYAQTEIKKLEDLVLERMMEADDLAGSLRLAEATLSAEQAAVDAEKRAIEAEHGDLHARVGRLKTERTALVAEIGPDALAVFDLVSRRRNGVALAEARDGICTICHVRMRPQVFNTVRRNDAILQCDSCQRIFYFNPPAAPDQAPQA